MATLKELRIRKKSVQATKKITMAMKMIAAAKLKKAHRHVEAGRIYAILLEDMVRRIIADNDQSKELMPLLTGTGKKDTHLIICVTSDRGLCGGFNSGIVRQVRQLIDVQARDGQQSRIMCVGQKGFEQLKRYFPDKVVDHCHNQAVPSMDMANLLTHQLIEWLSQNQFDVCTVVYNKFQTALCSEMTIRQLIPLSVLTDNMQDQYGMNDQVIYEYEPNKPELLKSVLPIYLANRIFNALLETAASEQGARMTAMDAATRNAQDMIADLELRYNRTRQGQITRELIEIISGAEAL